MDCDQEINKSDIEEHCSDCLCVGGMEDLDQQDVPATKAWRPTSVVEERERLKTLSKNSTNFLKVKSKNNSKSICPRDLKIFLELHTNDPKEPLIFLAEEIIISLVINFF